MSKANSITKAERATIKLGNIDLDVFQLPDGSYLYSYDFIATILGIDKKILSNKKSNYGLNKLLSADCKVSELSPKVKVSGISQSYTYNTLNEAQLMTALGSLARLGHLEAINLLTACAIEALERRADNAFNVKRTEEDRNSRLIERATHKKQYHPAYTAWIQRDGAIYGWEYGQAINALKEACGLPLSSIDQYDLYQLSNINRAEVAYDTARQLGADHDHALDLVANQSRRLGLVV